MKKRRNTDRASTMGDPLVRGTVALSLICMIVIVLPFGYSLACRVIAEAPDQDALFLERPDPRHTQCVRDTEYMRYHHWELLRRVREEVVRFGMRSEVGLKTCKECHTSRERFCNRCHDTVSLEPDCYGCHYYP